MEQNEQQYIVSARKYRPENFGTLIGQDNIARTLRTRFFVDTCACLPFLRTEGCGQDHDGTNIRKDDKLLKSISGYGALRGVRVLPFVR